MAFPEDTEFRQMLVKLMPLLPKAKDAIQILVQELKHGSIINWHNVRTVVIELFRRNFHEASYVFCSPGGCSCKEKIKEVIFSVLTLFDMHKCSDMSIIADVLELLCVTRYNRCNIANYGEWMAIRFNKTNDQTTMSIFERILVFSYKDIQSLVLPLFESQRVSCNWIEELAKYGYADVLKVAISYGAIPFVPRPETFTVSNNDFILQLFMKSICVFSRDALLNFRNRFRQDLLKLDNHSWKRMYFVSMVQIILFFSDLQVKDNECIQCARIFMNLTPEPLITFKEIKSFLSTICSGCFSDDEKQKILDGYESHFPEIREDSTPRPLKYLSRFQVRECLRIARSFPYGVELLCVPKKIQNYIKLKDIVIK